MSQASLSWCRRGIAKKDSKSLGQHIFVEHLQSAGAVPGTVNKTNQSPTCTGASSLAGETTKLTSTRPSGCCQVPGGTQI